MPSPIDHAMNERMHFARLNQQYRVRLFNPETRQYLHLSGTGETKGTDYSWCGWRHQAARLKAAAKRDGAPWPYVIETTSKQKVRAA